MVILIDKLLENFVMHIVIAITLFGFTACTGGAIDTIPPQSPNNSGIDTLIVISQFRHNYNEKGGGKNFSMKPMRVQDFLLFSSFDFSKEVVYCVDLESRALKWEWNECANPMPNERCRNSAFNRWESNKVLNGNFAFGTNRNFYLLQITNGTLVNRLSVDTGWLHNSIIYNNEVFLTISDSKRNVYSIEVCDYNLGCTTFLQFPALDHYDLRVGIPIIDRAIPGEKLIYIPFDAYRTENITGLPYDTAWVVAYNYLTKEMLWKNGEARYGHGLLAQNVQIPPIITDHFVLFFTSNTIHCFDKINGELYWKYQHPPSVSGVLIRPVIDHGRLYFGDSHGHITCLDLQTGSMIWNNDKPTETGGATNDLVLFKDKLYAVDRGDVLSVFDVRSGRGIGKYASPNRRLFGDAQINSINIDEERNVMYVDDGYYVLICEIPGE